MIIKIFGFELILGDGITFDQYFQHIDQEGLVQSGNRFMSLTSLNDDYWGGLLLTAKDQRSFCKMVKDGKSFTVQPEELGDNTSQAHFNFMIINKSTGRGLYQHYHNSASINSCAKILKKEYRDYKEGKVKALVDAGEREDRAKRKYKGFLRYSILARRESFDDIVNRLSRVKSLDFEFSTLNANGQPYEPLTNVANRLSHRVIFSANTDGGAVKQAIRGFTAGKKFRSGKIVGVDPDNTEVVYKMFNDFDTLENYD